MKATCPVANPVETFELPADLDSNHPSWTGEMFYRLLDKRPLNIRSETYEWHVLENSAGLHDELLEMIRDTYSGMDFDEKSIKDRLTRHELIAAVRDSSDALIGFIPLQRYSHGWRASFFGYRDRLIWGACVRDFCTVLNTESRALPFAMQISGGVAAVILKRSMLPLVPRQRVRDVKGPRYSEPTDSEIDEAVDLKHIPNTAEARRHVYRVRLSLCQGSSYYKVMVGYPMPWKEALKCCA